MSTLEIVIIASVALLLLGSRLPPFFHSFQCVVCERWSPNPWRCRHCGRSKAPPIQQERVACAADQRSAHDCGIAAAR